MHVESGVPISILCNQTGEDVRCERWVNIGQFSENKLKDRMIRWVWCWVVASVAV